MKRNMKNNPSQFAGNDEPPAWLTDLLSLAGDYEAFRVAEKEPDAIPREKVRLAAEAASAMRKMRQMNELIEKGQWAFSLTGCILALAGAAQAPLTGVLSRFGLTQLEFPTIQTIEPLARIALGIGLTLTETLDCLRFEVAEKYAQPLLVARYRSRASREDLTLLLAQAAKQYPPDAWRELGEMEEIVQRVYAKAD